MPDSLPSDGKRERSRATFDLVTDWLQIITSVVVIAGLGLVFWELQQARELTQAQLTSEGRAAHVRRSCTRDFEHEPRLGRATDALIAS